MHVLRHQRRPLESPQFGTALTREGAEAAAGPAYGPLRGLPVVSSPFLRCLQTVQPWRGEGFVDYGLCEHAPGVSLEIRPLAAGELGDLATLHGFCEQPPESEADLDARLSAALLRVLGLAESRGFPEVVVCTHQSCAARLCALLGAADRPLLAMGQWHTVEFAQQPRTGARA